MSEFNEDDILDAGEIWNRFDGETPSSEQMIEEIAKGLQERTNALESQLREKEAEIDQLKKLNEKYEIKLLWCQRYFSESEPENKAMIDFIEEVMPKESPTGKPGEK